MKPFTLTVDIAIDRYLREWSQPRGNYKTDAACLRAPRLAALDKPCRRIDQRWIDEYVDARRQGKYGSRPVQDATIRREVTALQAVLNRIDGGDGRAYRFNKPTGFRRRDRWLDEEEEQIILAAMQDESRDVQLFIRMGLSYGVRLEAMMDLKWNDTQIPPTMRSIDFNKRGAQPCRKRRPIVPMTPEIEVLLGPRNENDFVLARDTPQQFRRFMDRIGFHDVTPHILKHSAVSLMLRGGADIEKVAELTATSVRTLRDVYRHHLVEDLSAAMVRRA